METPKRIGIWGTAKSGKTTYLAMLHQAFQQSPDQWYIQTDEPARKFIKEKQRELYSENVFPQATQEISWYTYYITNARTQQILQFEFSDVSGELYEHFYDEELKHIKNKSALLEPQSWFQELSTMDGIIIVLDPAWEETQNHRLRYTDLVIDFMTHLRNARIPDVRNKPLINDMYVALMFVKADAEEQYWEKTKPDYDWINRSCTQASQNPSPTSCINVCPIYQKMGSAFMNTLSGIIEADNQRCFVVSAIGGRTDDSTNTAREHIWRTPDTPYFDNSYPQPAALTSQYQALSESLKSLPDTLDFTKQHDNTKQVDYFPTTIRNKDRLNPTNVIDPIAWFIQSFR